METSLEALMIEYWWLFTVYAVGGLLLGWALHEAWTMLTQWRSRRKDEAADPDVERITGGWRIPDDPNRDWATGEDKIPAYVDAYEAVPVRPSTYRSRFAEFVANTAPRTPLQYAIEQNPRPYIGRHSTDGYNDHEVKILNSGTGTFPAVRTLNPAWREAIAV